MGRYERERSRDKNGKRGEWNGEENKWDFIEKKSWPLILDNWINIRKYTLYLHLQI